MNGAMASPALFCYRRRRYINVLFACPAISPAEMHRVARYIKYTERLRQPRGGPKIRVHIVFDWVAIHTLSFDHCNVESRLASGRPTIKPCY